MLLEDRLSEYIRQRERDAFFGEINDYVSKLQKEYNSLLHQVIHGNLKVEKHLETLLKMNQINQEMTNYSLDKFSTFIASDTAKDLQLIILSIRRNKSRDWSQADTTFLLKFERFINEKTSDITNEAKTRFNLYISQIRAIELNNKYKIQL